MPISINVTLRSNKTSPLTWAEGDANWSLLVANDQYLDSQLGSKQTSNEKLTAIAASVWAANSILHLTGTNTLEVKPITAYGLQLIGYESDSALKIALALNNVSNTADTDKPVSTATQIELDKKVDKVSGKVLSSNDFTDPEKTKLAGLENSHFRGVFVSLSALTGGVSSPLAGDYADVDEGTGTDAIRYIWDVTDSVWVSSGSGTSLTAAQVKTLYESNPDTNAFTDSEETKLGGIADGATANATNAQLRDRSTHTGTQLASTISDLAAAVRLVTLLGLDVTSAVAIVAGDSFLVSMGKLQAQITARAMKGVNNDITRLTAIDATGFGLLRDGLPTVVGATSSVAGTKGLVPAPGILGANPKFLSDKGIFEEAAGGGGDNIGDIKPWKFSRATIPGGRLPNDGQIVTNGRTLYPEFWALIQPFCVTDAVWLAAPYTSRGMFSLGNGTTDFRMPDDNAKHADGNTIAAMVLRGDGKNSAGTPGLHQADQFQGFRTASNQHANNSTSDAFGVVSSAIAGGTGQGYYPAGSTAISNGYERNSAPFTDGVNGTPRSGTETRPANSTVIWCTTVAKVGANTGTVDVTVLSNTVNAQGTAIETKLSVISTGGTDTNGWRKYSDGTTEQWGTVSVANTASGIVFSFNTPFLSVVQYFNAAPRSLGRATAGEANSGYAALSLSQFRISSGFSVTPLDHNWYARGK
jgi:hypothetical protein